MAMGKRKSEQPPLWVPTTELPVSPGHPFYTKLNAILDEAGFDQFAETECRQFYAPVMGRPSLPPGRYFRLLLVGYFEGLDSERGIAWRAAALLITAVPVPIQAENLASRIDTTCSMDKMTPTAISADYAYEIAKAIRDKDTANGSALIQGGRVIVIPYATKARVLNSDWTK